MRKLLIIPVLLSFSMCSVNKPMPQTSNGLAPLIIYKMKADYSQNVPIVLNEKKDLIVSYPAPKDVFVNGKLAFPEKLSHGYYLDNIGLSANTAFTSYSLEAYSKLETAPSISELMKSIVDNDPFVEMYNCGNRTSIKSKKDLNNFIVNKFKECKRIK
jgi:hypothetical protein